MKKLLLFLMIGILLINCVSSLEFDNTLRYENNDMKVTLENAFGLPLFGSDLGYLELRSHKSVNQIRSVEIGNTVVMWYEFNYEELYKNGLGKIYFTDLNTGKIVDKNYTFVYLGNEIYYEPIYENQCNTLANNTKVCQDVMISQEEKTRKGWIDYNSNDIPKGKIIIGIRINIGPLEKLDAVWTVSGKPISRHAGVEGTYQFTDNDEDDVDRQTYTWSGMNLSFVDSNRVIVVGVGGRKTGGSFSVNTISINGHNATRVITAQEQASTAEIWYAVVPNSTSGNIIVNWNDTMFRNGLGVWAIYTGNSTPFDSSRFFIANGSAYLDVEENGVVIGYGFFGSGTGITWIGATENFDVEVESGQTSSGAMNNTFVDAQVDYEVDVSRNTVDVDIMVVASWGSAGVPEVNIVFPENITYNESLSVLNYTATSGLGGDRCWFSIDGGSTNSSDVAFGTNFSIESAGGSNTWIVFCNDTNSIVGQDSVTFFVNKSVTTDLISPTNATNFTTPLLNFLVNSTPSNTNLTNVTLFIWHLNNTLLLNNFTTLSESLEVQTNFTQNLPDGLFKWNTETCGEEVECSFAANNNTLEIHTIPPSITINFPIGNIKFFELGQNLTLNWTIEELGQNLTEHIANCSFTYNGIETPLNLTQCVEINETSFLYVSGINNLNFTVFDEFGLTTTNTTSWNFAIIENSKTFNSASFETKTETLIINITTNGTIPTNGKLVYNGTSTTATITNIVGDAYNVSGTTDIPLGVGIRFFFFNFTIGSTEISSSQDNQTISATSFALCNASVTVPYINFSFKNETTNQEDVNATMTGTFIYWLGTGIVNKTLSFANATENPNYTFCSSASNDSLNVDINLVYNNVGSQQRNFISTNLLTNITTQQVLYLLPTIRGLFNPFNVVDTIGNPISSARGTITRTLLGSPITVSITETDDSGLVTYFLNPDVTYSATFSRTGFTDTTFSFVPTTSIRTVIMSSIGVANVTGSNISIDLTYIITPTNSSLNNNTIIDFTFNVSGNDEVNLISMNITNLTGFSYLFQSNAGLGVLSGSVNTSTNETFIGIFRIQTTNETLIIKKRWEIGNEFVGDYSIFRQFTLFMDYNFGNFIRILMVIIILFAVLIFMTSTEVLDSSEDKVIVSLLLIWAFSIVGWLNTGMVGDTTLSQFSNQYGIAILTTAAGSFFIFRRLFIRRI